MAHHPLELMAREGWHRAGRDDFVRHYKQKIVRGALFCDGLRLGEDASGGDRDAPSDVSEPEFCIQVLRLSRGDGNWRSENGQADGADEQCAGSGRDVGIEG